MRRSLLALGAVTALACGGDPDLTTPGGGGSGGLGATGGFGAESGTGGTTSCAASIEVVHFDTDDGVTLEADLYASAEPQSPAVVLLHMTPPENDRTNYPAAFIDALVAQGIHVLNVDRRGAGASGGVPVDAYIGPAGKLDAKAGMSFLMQRECPPDPFRIGLVGASNGTTTVLDYAVYASEEPETPFPSALVFLGAGLYTEKQSTVSAHREELETFPMLFVFSPAEQDWHSSLQAGAPATWSFELYDPGEHGTKMLTARPESISRVAGYLADVL